MSTTDTRARCRVCGGYRNPTIADIMECCTCPDGPAMAQRHREIILGVERAREDRIKAERWLQRAREEMGR
jgi:hypothetical protein